MPLHDKPVDPETNLSAYRQGEWDYLHGVYNPKSQHHREDFDRYLDGYWHERADHVEVVRQALTKFKRRA